MQRRKSRQRSKQSSTRNSREQYIAIQKYNSTVTGLHNYYRLATRVSEDFPDLSQGLKKQMENRLKGLTKSGKLQEGFIKERYGKNKQLRFLNGHPLVPMAYVQTRNAQHKKKTVNRYTPEVNRSVKSRQWKKASPCRIIEPHEEVLLCPENTQK